MTFKLIAKNFLQSKFVGATFLLSILLGITLLAHSVQAAKSPTLKPVLKGVVYSKSIGDQDYSPTSSKFPPIEYQQQAGVDAMVVSVSWDKLQPDNTLGMSQPIAENNPIDQALETARSRGLKVKLRVFTGYRVPRWVKSLDFNCADTVPTEECGIHMTEQPVDGAFAHDEYIAKFWSYNFGQAYKSLQEKLAAKYDGTAEILQVTVSRCMTFYPETFIRQISYEGNTDSLLAAGYTYSADVQCHKEQIAAHNVWRKTRSGLALNPFQGINAGTEPNGTTFTIQMMDYCRKTLGKRCVLENYSIRTPVISSYQTMYDAMKTRSAPLVYQTATPARIGDWCETLTWAVNQGANSVELLDPNAWDPSVYPYAEIKTYDDLLTSN